MDTLTDAIETLRRGMVDADREALDSVTMDELSYGHTSGIIEDKQAFIKAIVGPNNRDDFKWIRLSEQTIGVANDVAVVRNRFEAEVLVNGAPMNPDIRVLQVWCLRGGSWKLLARQAYRV